MAGNIDVPWFLEGGARGYRSLVEALGEAGLSPGELGAVLDFGCGCGRVARHWNSGAEGQRFFGVDRNPYFAAWCAQNLRFGRFAANSGRPPLRLRAASVDFAYALSVFTHMPEAAQRAWLGELARVVAPGGHLVITTHRLSPATAEKVRTILVEGASAATARAHAGDVAYFWAWAAAEGSRRTIAVEVGSGGQGLAHRGLRSLSGADVRTTPSGPSIQRRIRVRSR